MRAEGKKTSQGMPSAVCYPQALYMEPIKVLKINSFSSRHQRPGEKCGLEKWTLEVFESMQQGYPSFLTARDSTLQMVSTSQQSVAAS